MNPTYEDLLRQLAQAKEEAKVAKEEAKVAKEEAKVAKEEARVAKDESDKTASVVRPTTLEEYLRACHEHVLSKMVLITEGYLSSRAPSTAPTRKHCPRLLTQWRDFHKTQINMIRIIHRVFPRNEQLFESIHFLETIGNRIHERRVYSEPSLVFIQNNCVEDPVRIILSKLKDFQPGDLGLAGYERIHFETTASSLRDTDDGKEAVLRDAKLRTDQICVSRNAGNERNIAYVIEYKAPYKLHTTHLEQGLRTINIVDEVVNKPSVPTNDPGKFQHYAELLSAAAVTQTYHYMLEAGLEYGYLTNGDAIVFLHIDWDDPTVLYYHLAQPSREVTVDQDPVYSNAVCQVLAFTVLALQTSQHKNDARIAATKMCETWEVDFACILDKIAQKEREDAQTTGPTTSKRKKHRRTPSSPEWLPKPIKRTNRNPEKQPERDNSSDRVLRSHNKRQGPGGGGGAGSGGRLSGTEGAGEGTSQGGSSTTGPVPASNNPPHGQGPGGIASCRPYCTSLCLLSLVNGRLLDPKCPNVALHRETGDLAAVAVGKTACLTPKHPVSHAQWMDLLRKQLAQSLEKGVVALGQQGGCGALFQITLLQYGYTFVAKGGTGRAVPRLDKEEAVYRRLQPLQGRHVPVCLGAVDVRPLGQVLFYDFDVRIIYFLLLSHGGTDMRATPLPDAAAQARAIRSLTAVLDEMHRLGVVHGDVRLPNVLQGPHGQLTLVDFDRAHLLPRTPPAPLITLHALSPRKRRWLLEEEAASDTATDDASARARMRQDIANAQSLFALDAGRIIERHGQH